MEKCDKAYNSICRVCLKQSKVEGMVSLDEKPSRRSFITFGKVLVKFARISIDYDDVLPTKICQNCRQMIQTINSFKLMCKTNDRKLRKFVNLAHNDREKYKEMICEYVMFSQYFPREGFRNTRSSPSSSSSGSYHEKIGKIKSKMEVLSPVRLKSDYQTSMNGYESDIEYYSDSILLDNNKNESCNASNVDSFLDSIEKVMKTEMKFTNSVKTQQKHSSNNTKNIDSFIDSIEKAINMRIEYSNMKTNVKEQPKVPKKVFHCYKCNRTLANRYTYNYHMQRHTNYLYICDQCGKGFPGNEPLNRHLVKNHDKGQSLQCDHCPFKCTRRFDLVEHIRLHTGERPFTCEKCGLTFRRKAIWTNHLVQHKEKLSLRLSNPVKQPPLSVRPWLESG
ncbi:Zinc finger protein 1-like protein [Operophtera brumata]|uniref:Zinc finger protein 1-like protein n=1 Tax=Operophtera brumata TaxID=104452 RepID=A0A0L7KY29_OPEBR|nr:Zinc finger protein 1-like protein [Operophtera brumata]